MLLPIAVLLVVLGLGQLAALLVIVFEYAMPRAPIGFRVALFAPMLVACWATLGMAYSVLYADQLVMGVDVILLLTIYFGAEALVWWAFVGCTLYRHHKGRNTEN